jgi:hypothetical protein
MRHRMSVSDVDIARLEAFLVALKGVLAGFAGVGNAAAMATLITPWMTYLGAAKMPW